MSKTPFMPLWVADFLADTTELDCKEVGAYMLLLMSLWQRGGKLPNDAKKLQRVARCGRDWPKIWGAIEHHFECDGETISNNRLSLELQKVDTKRRVNSHNGARGGAAKALKNNDVHLANASHSLYQPEPYLYLDKKNKQKKGDLFDARRWFKAAEIEILQAANEQVLVSDKLADPDFREWCFENNSAQPKLAATNWIAKQQRVEGSMSKIQKVEKLERPSDALMRSALVK